MKSVNVQLMELVTILACNLPDDGLGCFPADGVEALKTLKDMDMVRVPTREYGVKLVAFARGAGMKCGITTIGTQIILVEKR